MDRAVCCGGNTVDLHSGGTRLESRPGYRIFLLRFLVVFLSPPCNCRVSVLGHNAFQLIIRQSSYILCKML
jgi:hypothetical protein